MRTARGIALTFALAWLVVAGGLFGAIAGAQAAADPGHWQICAPSGAVDPDRDEARHAAQTCCTALCGFALMAASSTGAAHVVISRPVEPDSPALMGEVTPPAGLGVETARAPPANL